MLWTALVWPYTNGTRIDPCLQLSNLHAYRLTIILRLLSTYQRSLRNGNLEPLILTRLSVALGLILSDPMIQSHNSLCTRTLDMLALVSLSLSPQSRSQCLHLIQNHQNGFDPRISFILGPCEGESETSFHLSGEKGRPTDTTRHADASSTEKEERMHPFCLRRWDLVQDATPSTNENDASLSLSLFGARKTRSSDHTDIPSRV